ERDAVMIAADDAEGAVRPLGDQPVAGRRLPQAAPHAEVLEAGGVAHGQLPRRRLGGGLVAHGAPDRLVRVAPDVHRIRAADLVAETGLAQHAIRLAAGPVALRARLVEVGARRIAGEAREVALAEAGVGAERVVDERAAVQLLVAGAVGDRGLVDR